jgi:flagellar basal-body rod protein FlgG
MNYGLYVSASGLSVQMARQDILSNNLANVNTTAYKPDVPAVRFRESARAEDGLSLPSNALLERLGAGVMPAPARLDVSPASLEHTGNPLDLAIEGEGFLIVRTGDGDEGLRLTRDGRLAFSPEGRLVTASGGFPVLDAGENPITVDPSKPIFIRASGAIVQNGSEAGQLALVTVTDPSTLEKAGLGLLKAPAGETLDLVPGLGRIKQEYLEHSGTDPIMTMTGVTDASRAVSTATTVIGYINDMMGRAINSLGRTA